MSELILASASPRRRAILEQLGIRFRVAPTDADETRYVGEDAKAYVSRVAENKAHACLARLRSEQPEPFVLAADTIVVVDGDVLGKPTDDDDAASMMRRIVGRWHEVMSAVALARASKGILDRVLVETRVRFRDASEEEIMRYVASGEGRDKAGAYAAQGLGAGFVAEIGGSYLNVVGLPAVETLDLLKRHRVVEAWP